ncbi:MAG TPA: amidohydrolase [Propionibacteriaceae bacterium]|nr:amidohydrolase [Propionibacteriaceae bacterium]
MGHHHLPAGLGTPEFFAHSHPAVVGGGGLPSGRLHLSGVLLPKGEPTDLWVVDGLIRTEPVADAVTICRNAWIMPGLVDAHCHIGLGPEGAVPDAIAEAQALTDRDAGTLLVRDAGSPIDTHWIDDRADLPRIIRAGRHIAVTKRYLRGYANEIDPAELVDEVARQARRGDGWVKLVGDWIDRDLGDLAPLWPIEIAQAAIAKAHELGAKVTAHCFGEESVQQLVTAGIDGIEHGTGVDAATIEVMAANQVALVPTMVNLENFTAFAEAGQEKFPRYAAHMRDLHARRFQTLGAAVEAGVPVYAGTDAGGSIDHGLIGAEAALLARLGGTEFALGAASWRARQWLGAPPVVEGGWADLVVFDADPRRDIGVVAHPKLVILRGRVVRG